MRQAEYAYDPVTDRGRARRDLIISVATDLFHERGFDATGIDDIGEAAGITGPGVYRHFASKDEILIAVLDRIWMMLREGIDETVDMSPSEALASLIDTHVGLSVRHRAAFSLLVHDLRFLPESYRTLARSNRRTYLNAWVDSLLGVRPSLGRPEAVLMVGSVWRLASGSADAMVESGLDDDQLVETLTRMTETALLGDEGSV